MISDLKLTPMKEDGLFKKWACLKCLESITSEKSELNVKEVSRLEAYINDKINNSIESITNITTTALQNEIMKLKLKTKTMYQEIKDLKLLIQTQIYPQNIHRNPQGGAVSKRYNKTNN